MSLFKKVSEPPIFISTAPNVIEAVEVIKGYCEKHKNCEDSNCKFYFPGIGCSLMWEVLPGDWEELGD